MVSCRILTDNNVEVLLNIAQENGHKTRSHWISTQWYCRCTSQCLSEIKQSKQGQSLNTKVSFTCTPTIKFYYSDRSQSIRGKVRPLDTTEKHEHFKLTGCAEKAGLPAVEGQFLLTVLWLAEDGGQLLLASSVAKVGDVLVGFVGQMRRGQLRVVVLDHDPHLILCPGEEDRREEEQKTIPSSHHRTPVSVQRRGCLEAKG